MATRKLRFNLGDGTGPGKVGEALFWPLDPADNTLFWKANAPARIPLKYNDPAHASSDPGYAPDYTTLGDGKYVDAPVTVGASYGVDIIRVNQTKDVSPSFSITIPAGAGTLDLSSLTPSVVPLPTVDQIIDSAVAGRITNGALSGAAVDARVAPALALKVDNTVSGREKLATQDFAKWRPLFKALEDRQTAKADIGIMGPSTVAGYNATWASSFPQAMARRLRNRFPVDGLSSTQGGTGAIPVPDGPIRGVGATASPQSTPWTFAGGMLFDETAFSGGLNHTLAYTNAFGTGQLTTDRDLTDFKVVHVAGTAGGVAAAFIQANSLTAVTFNTNAGSFVPQENTFTAAALGFSGGVIPAGTVLKVGGTGTGAYFILSHAEGFYSDTAKGIHVHQIGHSGNDTASWEQATAPYATTRATIAQLGLDFLFMPFYGINAGATRTAAQWKSDMVAHIAWLRAGGVTCNIALIAAYDTTPTLTLLSPWADYVQAHREIAAADSTVAFYDLSLRMPRTNSTLPWAVPMYAADKIHLTESGNEHVINGILDYALSFNEGGPLGDGLPRKADLVSGKVPASQLPVTDWTTLSGKPSGLLAIPKWVSGRWYESQYLGFTISNFTTVAGTVYYTPITLPSGTSITDVGINVATAAASSAVHFGLYADANGQPGALVQNFGNIAATATGVKSIGSLGYTSATGGLFWLGFMSLGGTPQVSAQGASTAMTQILGRASVAGAQEIGWNQTGQSSLPATAASLVTVTSPLTRPNVLVKSA